MKFEVGDIVRLIHSGEEGEVVELLDNGMVRVEVNGMDFPVFEDQIEHPYFKRFSEMRKATPKKKKRSGADLPVENKRKAKINRKESGLFLSVLPVYDPSEDAVVSSLKLYLVNETQHSYQFYCKEYLGEELDFEVKSEILPFNQCYLKDLLFECLNDRPHLEFVFTPTEPTAEMAAEFTFTIKLKAKQVIKKIATLNSGQQAMFSYLLFEKYPLKRAKEKEEWDIPAPQEIVQYYKKDKPVPKNEFQYEIDLHIEKLTDDYRHLTASDMLLLQLAELHRALEQAIASRQYSMVVIHGIGKGVLKREVHEILKQTPEVKRFVNQHDFRYGFGATEIFFEYP